MLVGAGALAGPRPRLTAAQQYTGVNFPMRSGVVYAIEPERTGHFGLPFTH